MQNIKLSNMTSDELIVWRKSKLLTQAEAGRLLGVSRDTIHRCESGLVGISKVMHLATKWLFNDVDLVTGKELSAWRHSIDLKQKYLADDLGVTTRTVQTLEASTTLSITMSRAVRFLIKCDEDARSDAY